MEADSVLPFSSTVKTSWIDSVAVYIEKVPQCSLNFTGQKLGTEELESLFEHLPGSDVKELILSDNNLTNKMKALSDVLVRTDIKKLDVSNCALSKQDFFDLMEALKDTKIIELDMRCNEHYVQNDQDFNADADDSSWEDDLQLDYFEADELPKFISFLKESHLQILHLRVDNYFEDYEDLLYEAIASTKLIQFSFSEMPITLISSLHLSSLTDLRIGGTIYEKAKMKILSHALKNSNLRTLHLFNSDIPDEGVDILVVGLVHSKITELDLTENKIKGSNTLGLRLKDTQIKILRLNDNLLEQHGIFLSPDFLKLSQVVALELSGCRPGPELFQKFRKCLKYSKVTELNLSFNNLQYLDISKFAKILKKTNLERVSLFGNKLSLEAAVALADGIKGSKLNHIDLCKCFKHPEAGILLPLFLAGARDSAINSLKCKFNDLNEAAAQTLALHLENTTISQLDVSTNCIANGVSYFGNHLKFTALSHLNLGNCKIEDEGVETLAAHLKESQLIKLVLYANQITSHGAKSLALSLKGSKLLCLYLDVNKIKNDGLEALAEGAKNTFLTDLSVKHNPGTNFLMIDAVMCQNKVSAYRLCSTFKRIAPQKNDCCFSFSTGVNEAHISEFLDDCLDLYKNIIHEPAAIEVLRDESISCSRNEITLLMSSEFPEQFSQFIAREVDAETEDHINLLKKAEDQGLNKVVELLLFNRPLYAIDRNESILHPYVYQLLSKYNHPICNTDIEPDSKTKIINYFKNNDIEGAADVIRLLQGKRKQ